MNLTKARSMLLEEIGKQGYTLGSLALTLDINVSTLSRFFNDSRETPPNLVAKIVKTLKPEIESSFMTEYCSSLDKPRNLTIAMEYCSTHRLLDVLNTIIQKGLTDRNSEVNEFARIYSYQYKVQTNTIKPNELYEEIRHERVNHEETKVLARILEVYSLYQQKQYSFMITSLGNLENRIEGLEEEYFRQSYMARLSEILMVTSLKVSNDPKACRKYAKKVLDAQVGKMYKGSAYHLAGASYFFENHEKCLKYYEKSKKYYKSIGRQDCVEIMEYNTQLAQVTWGTKTDSFFIDSELKSYNHIKNGQVEIGLNILDELDSKEENESPFRLYLRGEATGEIIHYWKSLKLYKARGDKFIATLPKIRLLALGENEFVVNSFLD